MKQTSSVKLFLSALFLFVSFWKAFPFNYQLCEGYVGQNERYHSGFYCPRLSDPPEQIYCCRRGNNSLKYCCNQMEFERIMTMNLSDILATSIHRFKFSPDSLTDESKFKAYWSSMFVCAM
uniref:Protein shisa-like-1a isoform X2 n=1 Tax=Geotrypetes seraphini TaxID=260995 RepID=A0A6P8NI17_GEOSA|nr:protein shisa-like-1a isoform X2 [Geotrypetes seraphini]